MIRSSRHIPTMNAHVRGFDASKLPHARALGVRDHQRALAHAPSLTRTDCGHTRSPWHSHLTLKDEERQTVISPMRSAPSNSSLSRRTMLGAAASLGGTVL